MSISGGNAGELLAVVATIDPDAYGTGTQTTDIIDMRYWEEIYAVAMAGTLGSTATLDMSVATSANADMSSPTTLTGKAITQLTEAGTDSDKQSVVHIDASEVAGNGTNHRYLQFTMTIGTATSDAGAIVLGYRSRYSPGSDFDLASVAEVVL